MPTNFLQWNPGGTNQESDSTYTADSMRTGGAANPSILPSALANKLYYQVSTFIAAFAQALSAKGYTVSDASLSTLAGTLANVTTAGDLAAALALYAPLLSPALTGNPTAPTQAAADNSTKLATTAYVQQQNYIKAVTAAMVLSALGFSPVQQGGGNAQSNNKLFLGWDGAHVRGQVDTTDFGGLAWTSDLAGYQPLLGFVPVQQGGGSGQASNKVQIGWDNIYGLKLAVDGSDEGYVAKGVIGRESIASPGYQCLPWNGTTPNGLIVQWGSSSIPTGNGDVITLPKSFPHAGFMVVANDMGAGALSVAANINSANSIKIWAKDDTGAFHSAGGIAYIALGY